MRRASRSEVVAWVWALGMAAAAAEPWGTATNINMKVETPGLEHPLVIRFKGFRKPEEPSAPTNTRATNAARRPGERPEAEARRRKRRTDEEKAFGEAEALFRHGDHAAAAERLRQVIATGGGAGGAARQTGPVDAARILLARIAFTTNDLEGALRELDAVTGRKTEASLWRIRFLVGRTNDSAAIAVWERLKQDEEFDGWFVEAFVAVREAFLRKGLGPALVADGESLLAESRVKSGKDRLLYGLADLYERDKASRDLRKAHRYYRRVVEEHAGSPYAEAAGRRMRHLERRYLDLK